jgi:hypothetical protein
LETKDVKSLEEKKTGVKGVGRKTTDESEHFTWRDDVKVPCGKLMPSGNKDGPLEYNEFAVYDPKQVNHLYQSTPSVPSYVPNYKMFWQFSLNCQNILI